MKYNIYKQVYNEKGYCYSEKLVATFYNEELASRVYEQLVKHDMLHEEIDYRWEEVKND